MAGWIGLDPVDRTGTGSDAAAQLDAPAIVLLGGASSCNLFGSGRAIAKALPHLVRTMALKDASHCDFEDPTNNFCRVMCGKSSAQMQARIRGETVRAALELLATAKEKGKEMEGAATVPPAAMPEDSDPVGPPQPEGSPEPDATAPP